MPDRSSSHDPRPPSAIEPPALIAPLLSQIGRFADHRKVAAYVVGGCVRDWILGAARSTDLDIMVEGEGIAFAKALATELGVGVISHEQFGTATLMVTIETASPPAAKSKRAKETTEVVRVDVATCRRETYAAPAAYPTVERGHLADDLFRRDFTINAMAMALEAGRFGELVDPYQGYADLRARRLRVLHKRSFIDDPSRILRGARLLTRFHCTLDPETGEALRDAVAKNMLAHLNRGRLRRELERIVEEPDPVACLVCLAGWLATAPRDGTGA